jgi:hypothetical protein
MMIGATGWRMFGFVAGDIVLTQSSMNRISSALSVLCRESGKETWRVHKLELQERVTLT